MKKFYWIAALFLALAMVMTGCDTDTKDVPVTGVTLNKTSITLNTGGTETLKATVAPSDATNKAVTWESSDTAIATVASGTVTAVAVGKATITVTTVDGNKTDTCEVDVNNNVTLEKPTISPTNNVEVGTKLTATYSGSESVTYQWKKDGTAISGATSSEFTPTKAGVYTVTVSAENCNPNTSDAVTVKISPVIFENGVWSVALGEVTVYSCNDDDGDTKISLSGTTYKGKASDSALGFFFENPVDLSDYAKVIFTFKEINQWWDGGIVYFHAEDAEPDDDEDLPQLQYWTGSGSGDKTITLVFADMGAGSVEDITAQPEFLKTVYGFRVAGTTSAPELIKIEVGK